MLRQHDLCVINDLLSFESKLFSTTLNHHTGGVCAIEQHAERPDAGSDSQVQPVARPGQTGQYLTVASLVVALGGPFIIVIQRTAQDDLTVDRTGPPTALPRGTSIGVVWCAFACPVNSQLCGPTSDAIVELLHHAWQCLTAPGLRSPPRGLTGGDVCPIYRAHCAVGGKQFKREGDIHGRNFRHRCHALSAGVSAR